MASFVTNRAAKEMLEAFLSSETVKVALVTSTYAGDKDDVEADAGGANDVVDGEISVSGYTGGYGGAGRKTLANKSFSADDSDDEGVFDNTVDLTWTSLAAGATIAAAVLLIEDFLGAASDDTDTLVIARLELSSPVPTNGSDFTLSFDTEGLINANT